MVLAGFLLLQWSTLKVWYTQKHPKATLELFEVIKLKWKSDLKEKEKEIVFFLK